MHWNVYERSKFLWLLGYGYVKNNMTCLGGYSTHQNVAVMSNLILCLYDQGGWCAYQDLHFWCQMDE